MEFGIVSIQILRATLGIDHCSMEISSRTKTELIKPVFLAVGVPLAFSLASLILEKIRTKKSSCLKASSPDIHVNALKSTNSHEFSGDGILVLANAQLGNSGKDEILGLRSTIEDIQEREMMMEVRFLRCHELKVQEFVLMEVENNLFLELAWAEFMEREVSSMKEENQKFEAMEAVILSKDMELLKKSEIIKKLEDETQELRMAIQSLQEEKNELLKKLEIEESLGLTKESKKGTMKDYDQVINELEQLQKDRATETKELIYLRWSNACLKHKLFRMNQEQEGKLKLEGKKTEAGELQFGSASGEMSGFGFENESNSSSLAHIDQSVDPSVSFKGGSHDHGNPKRRKIYEKLKKWVEGGEKVRKNKVEAKKKPELKFFGSHSVAHFEDEKQFLATKSLSRA